MLAQKDDYIKEASDTIYQLSQEEKIRLQCEAREDYYRRECRIAKQHDKINELTTQLTEKDAQLSEKNALIDALRAEITQLKKK